VISVQFFKTNLPFGSVMCHTLKSVMREQSKLCAQFLLRPVPGQKQCSYGYGGGIVNIFVVRSEFHFMFFV